MKGLLLAIVVVQLVCHAPRTGLNIYEMVMVGQHTLNGDDNKENDDDDNGDDDGDTDNDVDDDNDENLVV